VGLLVLLHVVLAADGDAADATSTAAESTQAFFTSTTSSTSPSSSSTPAPTSSTPLASISETSVMLVSSTSLVPSSTPASTSSAAPTTIAAASTEGVVLSTSAAPDARADSDAADATSTAAETTQAFFTSTTSTTSPSSSSTPAPTSSTPVQGTSPPRATPRPAPAYPVEKEVAGARVRVLGEFEFELPAGGVAGLAQGHVLQIKPPKATVRRAAGADESFAAVLQQVMGLTITLPSGAWPSEAVEIPSVIVVDPATAGPTGPWATNASVLLLRGTLFFIKPENLNLAQGAVISLPVDRQVSRQAGNPNDLTQARLSAHSFRGATWRHLGGELRKGVDSSALPHDVLLVNSRELGALAVFQTLLPAADARTPNVNVASQEGKGPGLGLVVGVIVGFIFVCVGATVCVYVCVCVCVCE
jgi:hypothetical protein